MGKTRFFAIVMAIVMLAPMLMSCHAGKSKNSIVKADDPWYESSRFELAQDLGQFDMIGSADVYCASDDKVFYMYCYTTDRWASSKTVIDSYDFDGNLVKRTRVSYPEGFMIDYIRSVHADPEGTTLKATIDMSYNNAVIRIYSRERMLIELMRFRSRDPRDYYKEILLSYRRIIYDLDFWKVEEYASMFANGDNLMILIDTEVL